jgi:D-alanyl-D-alanine carboxypeptidase
MRKFLILLACIFLFVFLFSLSSYAISARSACAIEASSGKVYFAKNENEKLSMASTTKIMTAIVVIENCKLSDKVEISTEAVGIEGSSIYLKEGEVLTVEQLLYALLLESANDASIALAIHCAGSVDAFVKLMNKKALDLSLKSTNFANPHGLDDENHYTTALELAKIASYAMNLPVFCEIVSTYKKVIPLGDDGSRVLINHNKLLRTYKSAIGIKTGFTRKSGRCLVSCAEKDDVRLICVTLNAPNDWNDHKSILDEGFNTYEGIRLANAGDYVLDIPLANGKKSSVLCSNIDDLSVTLKKGNINISAHFEAIHNTCAPIKQGDLVGRIVFKNNDDDIAFLNLYALENIQNIKNKKSFFERIFNKNGKN